MPERRSQARVLVVVKDVLAFQSLNQNSCFGVSEKNVRFHKMSTNVYGRTTRGQADPPDSSPARHVSQGDQRQLSTAHGTNELFSSPYKREERTGRGGRKKRVFASPRERTYLSEGR